MKNLLKNEYGFYDVYKSLKTEKHLKIKFVTSKAEKLDLRKSITVYVKFKHKEFALDIYHRYCLYQGMLYVILKKHKTSTGLVFTIKNQYGTEKTVLANRVCILYEQEKINKLIKKVKEYK